MSVDVSPANSLFEQFKAAVGKDDVAASKRLLSALKLELTKFPALPPASQPSANAQEQLTVARDILELAVLASVRQSDDAAFDRNYAQLRPLYLDARPALPPSQQQPLLSGLRLLSLLVQNRIAEFHTEVELLPDAVLSTPEVAQVMQLEAWLMEGAYNKVLAARTSPASPYYITLLDRLATTVRDEVASCSEASYASLPVADAARMLRLSNEAELAAYAGQRGWTLADGQVAFEKKEGGGGPATAPPAFEIIQHCLEYAKELERIV